MFEAGFRTSGNTASTLESFLSATTPKTPEPKELVELWKAFYESSAFGVAVDIRHLDYESTEYFVPTLSALNLPRFQYSESLPPHERPPFWQQLHRTRAPEETVFDRNSWVSVLWRPTSRVPAEPLDGSVLVYYSLDFSHPSLEVIGLLGYKLEAGWVQESTGSAMELYQSLCQRATDVTLRTGVSHQDYSFIISREFYTLQ